MLTSSRLDEESDFYDSRIAKPTVASKLHELLSFIARKES